MWNAFSSALKLAANYTSGLVRLEADDIGGSLEMGDNPLTLPWIIH